MTVRGSISSRCELDGVELFALTAILLKTAKKNSYKI